MSELTEAVRAIRQTGEELLAENEQLRARITQLTDPAYLQSVAEEIVKNTRAGTGWPARESHLRDSVLAILQRARKGDLAITR